MNIEQLLEKFCVENIHQGKNVSKEWIGVNCPFCQDTGFHGGFNIEKQTWYHCWKCGHHFADDAFALLAGIKKEEAKKLLGEVTPSKSIIKGNNKIGTKPFSFPIGCGKMKKRHKEYLESRNYDPDFLESKYHLQGTNHLGEYRHRIIAPIIINERPVSYQGRDITGLSFYRYKACKMEEEIIHHKHTLYSLNNAKKDSVIVVEGITGVWRWGDNVVATFGIQWKMEQAMLLLKYKRVIIFFDSDDNARKQSEKLANYLESFGVETIEMNTGNDKDPAELTETDVKYYKKYFKIS